jgi:hypothetical protein
MPEHWMQATRSSDSRHLFRVTHVSLVAEMSVNRNRQRGTVCIDEESVGGLKLWSRIVVTNAQTDRCLIIVTEVKILQVSVNTFNNQQQGKTHSIGVNVRLFGLLKI